MNKIKPRNLVGVVLLILSIGLLIPGLLFDFFSVNASKTVILFSVGFEKQNSILGTIGDLAQKGNGFVAFLILLFSVLVPFAKALTMGIVAMSPRTTTSHKLYKFVGLISKWSMADVFVAGIFIAYLSSGAIDEIQVTAEFHSGFYFFTAYCITSILAVQIIKVPHPSEITPA